MNVVELATSDETADHTWFACFDKADEAVPYEPYLMDLRSDLFDIVYPLDPFNHFNLDFPAITRVW